MNFNPPKKSATELLLYIWKIIDLPEISFEDLVYKISFDLYIVSPEKAGKLIERAISSKLIDKNGENLKLSNRLKKTLETWQEKRKKEILVKQKMYEKKYSTLKDVSEAGANQFNALFNAFSDKGTIARSLSVSENDYDFEILDLSKGIIKGTISGSKDVPYFLEINTQTKLITHNCHDFENRRAPNKKFCKHLAKLFLILKEKNENDSISLLEKISEKINMWEFQTST